MARYRAKDTLWLDGRRIRPGQEFESDAKPGKKWELLEASAPPPEPVAEQPAPPSVETPIEEKPQRKRGKGAE